MAHVIQRLSDQLSILKKLAERARAPKEPATLQLPNAPTTVPLSVDTLIVEADPSLEELEAMAHRVEATWRHLGVAEPHWSVLSAEEFLRTNIAGNEESFYETADYDCDLIRSSLKRCGVEIDDLPTCLEYGCGIGRATWKLASLFERLIACDISESHLEHAKKRLLDTKVDNVEFVRITSAIHPLQGLEYDCFFSRLVLQHNPPPLIVSVIREALSCLRPGGVAIFQVPTYAVGYSFRVKEYLRRPENGQIEMHCLPQRKIFDLVTTAGCDLIEVREDWDTGQRDVFISNTFVTRKRAGLHAGRSE